LVKGPDQGGSAVPDPASQRSSAPASRPLPGSVAASNRQSIVNPRSQGPQVVSGDGEENPVQADYAGPAVLSRSYTLARPTLPQQVKWTPSFGANTTYQTGLTGNKVSPDGSLPSESSVGTSLTWGFAGRHFWKHDGLGIDYSGNYNSYRSASAYSGSNQSLNADYSHEFSRHLTLSLVESGSMYSQSYALQNTAVMPGTSVANINLAASPSVAVLDQGTSQFTSMADVTYQKSARLSFNTGIGYFGVQRSGSLFGNTGSQARADVNYRYNRKTTVGIYYSFSDYNFSRHVEIYNAQTLGGIFSYAFNRSTQFRFRGGATRSESEGLTSVPIDPVIAILIGRGSTIVDEYHRSVQTDISAEFARDLGRNRSLTLAYTRGIAPGNGLILSSTQEFLTIGISARWFRIYAASLGVGRTTLSSVSQTTGKYDTEYASFSLSRPVMRGMTASFGVDYRKFKLSNQPNLQNQLRISTGFSWSPSGKLW
jgi:hypothetical protein